MADNVFKKLSKARLKLQTANTKKSGRNKHTGFSYYELSDFLPLINQIFDELGLLAITSYGATEATMLVVNTDNPDDYTSVTSPIEKVDLKGGANEVQKIGAAQTYLRRYLYLTLLEIVEHDTVDRVMDANEKKQDAEDTTPISEAQLKKLCTALTKNNRDTDKFNAWLLEMYKIDSKKKIPKMLFNEILNVVEGK